MKCTFVSNYINHHQIPLSEELYERLGEDYRFVQTEPMEQERLAMGWGADLAKLPWLVCSYEQPQEADRLIAESDIVIFGGCEREEMIRPRLAAGKPVLRYSERIYKEGQWKFVTPRGLIRKYRDHIRYRKAPVFLLCAGAYVASDFALIRSYPHKMLKYGYFTRFIPYGEELHAVRGQNETPVILWAGRFLDWKHPDDAIKLAADLKRDGMRFRLCMIGGGEMDGALRESAEKQDLSDCVSFTGFLKPDEVRERMRGADLFLFTSDHREGWGAVLNEALNSGCAVVADKAAGASHYLIRDGENGFLYDNKDYETFKRRVKELLADRTLRRKLADGAYETIRTQWNPREAAERLLSLCGQVTVRFGEKKLDSRKLTLPEDGPLSPAQILKPGLWNQKCGQ